MGVFAGHIFLAALVAMPWRSRSASGDHDEHGHDAPTEHPSAAPARQTGWDYNPSSSVLRADLEALRALSRVK